MKGLHRFCLLIISLALLNTAAAYAENTVTIFAAAGTRLATEDVCDLFEKNEKIKVERNYASSGILARQIASGASCDVYISANKQWIDFLIEKKLLDKDTVHVIAGNSLTMIVPKDSALKPPVFSKDFDIMTVIPDKAVIGDPAYVPVGKYAKQAFTTLGWYDRIKSKAILAKDVSAVLRYVELGECDWGVVYYTEAVKSKKVRVWATLPEELHKPIVFYIANLKDSSKNGQLLAGLFTDKAGRTIFINQGFKAISSK